MSAKPVRNLYEKSLQFPRHTYDIEAKLVRNNCDVSRLYTILLEALYDIDATYDISAVCSCHELKFVTLFLAILTMRNVVYYYYLRSKILRHAVIIE